VPFETKRVREDRERVFYTVVVLGFSTIAITGSEELDEPKFEVTGLSIEPATPAPGQAVTITAQVRNIGDGDGTYPASLWVAETVEIAYTVPLDAGESRTISFTRTPRIPGGYAVRVERLLGAVTVVAPADEPAPTVASGDTTANGAAASEGQAATPAPASSDARAETVASRQTQSSVETAGSHLDTAATAAAASAPAASAGSGGSPVAIIAVVAAIAGVLAVGGGFWWLRLRRKPGTPSNS